LILSVENKGKIVILNIDVLKNSCQDKSEGHLKPLLDIQFFAEE
jgi:hypothetical protein